MALKRRIVSFREESKSERGLVIVEAAFIYPLVFILLVLVMSMSEMYYQRARVESLTLSYAQQAAAEMSDSMDYDVAGDGESVRVSGQQDRALYRYILGSHNDFATVEGKVESAVTRAFDENDIGFFGPAPTLDSVSVTYGRHFTYEELKVSVDYGYRLPFLGKQVAGGGPFSFEFNASAELPVLQSAEFVRNFDLANDMVVSFEKGTGTFALIENAGTEVCRFLSFVGLADC
ncbi:hypothetical protein SAMN06309944_2028 [Micrococcales bacterium KH10]|nr:hypothetical protein SAMN06309944_2028 [Micrococcales bacterium KH10]